MVTSAMNRTFTDAMSGSPSQKLQGEWKIAQPGQDFECGLAKTVKHSCWIATVPDNMLLSSSWCANVFIYDHHLWRLSSLLLLLKVYNHKTLLKDIFCY